MDFDAREAHGLKAGDHMTFPEQPGLRLEASATVKSWIYRYKSPLDGRMRQMKLGTYPAMPPHRALTAWEDARRARNEGRDPQVEKREKRATVRDEQTARVKESRNTAYTVAKLADDYLTGHVEAARKAKGASEIRRMFATMLGAIEARPAATITRTDAFNLITAYKGTPVQASKLRGELGAAWDYALDSGRLSPDTPNWWRQIMRGKLRSKGRFTGGRTIGKSERALTPAEIAELIRWFPNFSRLVDDALTVYLFTCVRGSEIMSVEAHEILEESDGWVWTIPKAKTKSHWRENATDHRVPLVGRAKEVLLRRKDAYKSGFLFPSEIGGHVQQKTIGAAVHYHMPHSRANPDRVRPRLPVTHWAPHDLRRTGRTMLSKLGCPPDAAEVIIGHMVRGVEGVYNKYAFDTEKRVWLEKLSAYYEGLVDQSGVTPGQRQAA